MCIRVSSFGVTCSYCTTCTESCIGLAIQILNIDCKGCSLVVVKLDISDSQASSLLCLAAVSPALKPSTLSPALHQLLVLAKYNHSNGVNN